ncbi:hypothetical protein V2G26_017036 [Clonostachys chloroleuca]
MAFSKARRQNQTVCSFTCLLGDPHSLVGGISIVRHNIHTARRSITEPFGPLHYHLYQPNRDTSQLHKSPNCELPLPSLCQLNPPAHDHGPFPTAGESSLASHIGH